MTREMQDGINTDAAGMDHSIPLVAYYIDGLYAWTASEIALFPRSVHVRIAVRWTTRDGHVIDRENGDATAAQAAAWAHQRRLDGYPWPTVYCSVSNQAEVIAAFQAIHEPMPLWWLAHYDNVDALPAGCVAKQYADPGPLDKSIVADYWAGVDQGGTMAVLGPDDHAAIQADLWAVLTSSTLRFSGRNFADMAVQSVNTGFANQAALAALTGARSADEAAILAAVQGVDGDLKAGVAQLVAAFAAPTVDVKQFAAALAPALAALLPPGTPPAVLGEAVVAALEAHLATPPTGGTP
jgi:hypothetical protein